MPLLLALFAFGAFVGSQIDDKLDKNEPPPSSKPSLSGLAVTVILISGAVAAASFAYKKVRGK